MTHPMLLFMGHVLIAYILEWLDTITYYFNSIKCIFPFCCLEIMQYFVLSLLFKLIPSRIFWNSIKITQEIIFTWKYFIMVAL